MTPGRSLSSSPHRLIKCVVWDLDNTLWAGIAAEGNVSEIPAPDRRMLDIIKQLGERGIVSSIASRNDPSMLPRIVAHPQLEGNFVAPQVGWWPKSQSLRSIAASLNISPDALAFVDDSPYERAEVSYMLPQVVVLSPDELQEQIDGPLFDRKYVTKEGANRTEMYRQEETRKAAEASFGGSREGFLQSCNMRLRIAPATGADLERIFELTERTHQLNSTGRKYTVSEISARITDERWLLPTAHLTDRFGDYGMVGAAIVDLQPPPRSWLTETVMLSCRVEGRGIPAALLRWIMGAAKEAGVERLRALYRVNEQNLPMRLLFRQMGLNSAGVSGDLMVAARNLSEPLPDYPSWLHVNVSDEAYRS